MNKILLLFIFLFSFWGKGQNFILQDSLRINIPDSYSFSQADVFSSLYFISPEENSLLKYNISSQQISILKNFTPSKKLFLVNPFFIVVWDKINKTLEFYDDKFISTQDKLPILQNQIINPNMVYIQDNRLLTYFDEFTTGSFIQKDYRSNKNMVFSNALPKYLFTDYHPKEIYASKQSRFLLLKKTGKDSLNNGYKVIRQSAKEDIVSYDIPQLDHFFWSERNFYWIDGNNIFFYDFENEPKKIQLPQKGEFYYILNQQLFLWKSRVMYLYKLETELEN